MIFIQLILLFVITIFSFYLQKKNLFSPSVLLGASASVCTLFCILNYNNWNMNSYEAYTVWLIIISVISFSTVSYVVSRINITVGRKTKKNHSGTENKIDHYYIPNWFTLGISIILAVCTYLYYKEISYIAQVAKNMYPIKDYDMLWYVKNIDTGLSVNFIVSNLTDLGYVLSYLYIFFLIYNILSTRKIKKYIMYLLPIGIYAVQSILFGGRTGLLQMLVLTGTLVFYLVASIRNKRMRTVFRYYMKRLIPVGICALLIFWYLNDVSGRSGTNMSPFYYISVYIGSGIKNLDSFLRNFDGICGNDGFGWETFCGIYTFIKRFTNINYDGLVLEFQPRINGLFMGNIYSAIRRYYYDFGVAGIIILPSVISIVLTILEKKTRKIVFGLNTKSSSSSEAVCIIYGIFVYAVVIFFMEDFFFINIISVNYLLKILELVLCNWFLLKIGLVKRIKRKV